MSKNKVLCTGTVADNNAIGQRFGRLKLLLDETGSATFSHALPGQFAEIDLCSAALPSREDIPVELADAAERKIILRRPFSFCSVRTGDDGLVEVEFLYSVLGPGTLRMRGLAEGDKLSLIGPLGNGFWVPEGKQHALLIAGGIGVPPLEHLAGFLKAEYPEIEVVVLAGAKNREGFPFRLEDTGKTGVKTHVTTDDGSAGFAGFVTDFARQWLDESDWKSQETVIYSCGPEAMLAEVAKSAAEHDVNCQVSMERMMACGIGLCQSCAVEVRTNGESETAYELCCKDGPVFDSKKVIFKC